MVLPNEKKVAQIVSQIACKPVLKPDKNEGIEEAFKIALHFLSDTGVNETKPHRKLISACRKTNMFE